MKTVIDMVGGTIIAACIWANLVIGFQHFIQPSRFYRWFWNTVARLFRWLKIWVSLRSVDYGGLVIISLVLALTCLGVIAFC